MKWLLPLLSLPLLSVPAAAYAQPPSDGHQAVYNFTWENDIVANTDRNYTNGVRFAYLTRENDIPETVRDLAYQFPLFPRTGRLRASFALGQSMFTPDDITKPAPGPHDRPYAGWLYGSAGLISDTGSQLDSLQLTLGIVGPASLAEQTQEFVHDLINSPDPNGWDTQLRNEPGLILTYERKWRSLYEFSPFGYGVDLTPNLGASAGNVFTYGAAGLTARFGHYLPVDYGPPRIRPSLPGSDFFLPSESLSWYIFAGVEARAVARNIFLDGNTFRDSYSVDRKVLTGDAQVGLAVIYRDVRIAYTHVFRAREYHEQIDNDEFGAVTLSFRY